MKKEKETVLIGGGRFEQLKIEIKGINPLIIQSRDKLKEKLKVPPNIRNLYPENEEFFESLYLLSDSKRTGVKSASIKKAMVAVGIKLKGIKKSYKADWNGAVIMLPDDADLFAIDGTPEPFTTLCCVPPGSGKTVLVTRAIYNEWSITVKMLYDTKVFDKQTIFTCLSEAGIRNGIGCWRPQMSGEYGRFQLVA